MRCAVCEGRDLALRVAVASVTCGAVALADVWVRAADPAIVCLEQGQVRVECRGESKLRRGTALPASVPYQLGLLSAGEWFGDKTLLTGFPADFSFIADTQALLIVISARAFFPHQRRASGYLLRHLRAVTAHRTQRLLELSGSVNGGVVGAMARARVGAEPDGSGAGAGAGPASDDSPATSSSPAKPRRLGSLRSLGSPTKVRPPNAAFPIMAATALPSAPSLRVASVVSPTRLARPPTVGRSETASPPQHPHQTPSLFSPPSINTAAPAQSGEVGTFSDLVSPIHVTDSARRAETSMLALCRPSSSVFSTQPVVRAVTVRTRSTQALRSVASAPEQAHLRFPMSQDVKYSLSPRVIDGTSRPQSRGDGFVGKGRSKTPASFPSLDDDVDDGSHMSELLRKPAGPGIASGAVVWRLQDHSGSRRSSRRSSRAPSASSKGSRRRKKQAAAHGGPRDIRSFFNKNPMGVTLGGAGGAASAAVGGGGAAGGALPG